MIIVGVIILMVGIGYWVSRLDYYDDIKQEWQYYNGATRSDYVKITFKQFQSFYFADPDNWEMTVRHRNGSEYYCPHYMSKDHETWVCLTGWREYVKLNHWYRSNLRKGTDYANSQATLELAQSISDKVQERITETQARTQQAYEDMLTLLKKEEN